MPDLVRFGPFELDLETAELQAAGRTVRLPEQQFQILQMLLLREGGVVSREEIRKKLWPNDTVVEFDRSINAAIMKLRISLGDTADKPGFIETLARRGYRLMVAAERVKSEPSESPVRTSSGSSLIGRKVSHYRALGILGGGGMGVVYKGEDLKLNRPVAMKFLPEELSADPVTLQRFEREAQTASSLNHPNICTIFEVEEFEGQPFIVMELLEGESLREVIARSVASSVEGQGGLPLGRLLDIASQIAEGLNAAHQKGIIHRDIKPANIFVSPAGRVKILDFGLAKLADLAPGTPGISGPFESPVRIHGESPTDLNLSLTGITLGTAGYMSPEQVRGEKLDARTDLFSFGLILYEMATGQRAFRGETSAIVQNAILHQPLPPVRELNPELPIALDEIISKALKKDRRQRYRSASEILAALKSIRAEAQIPSRQNPAGLSGAQPQRKHPIALGWVAGGLLTVILAAVAYFKVERQQGAPFEHFTIQKVGDGDQVWRTAISPDGAYLASIIIEKKGDMSLWVRHIPTGTERPIIPSAVFGYFDAVFSPSGGYIYFRTTAQGASGSMDVYRVPTLGGQPVRVVEDVDAPLTFIDQGSRVCIYRQDYAAGTYKFLSASADGGDEQVLVNGKRPLPFEVACAPNGRSAALIDAPGQGTIEILDFSTGLKRTLISSDGRNNDRFISPHWNPSGDGLFVNRHQPLRSGGQLSFISYPDGKIREITNDLGTYRGIDVTANGNTIATTQTYWNSRFEELSLAGPPRTETHGPREVNEFSWLDNGRILADGPDGALARVIDLAKDEAQTLNTPRELFFFNGALCDPETLVAAGSSRNSTDIEIFRMHLDGSGATKVTPGPSDIFPACTHDGKWLFYMDDRVLLSRILMRMSLKDGATREVGAAYYYYSISPDGKMLVFASNTPPAKLRILSTETLQEIQSFPVPDSFQNGLSFSADNKGVFYATKSGEDSTIWRQPLGSGAAVKVATLREKSSVETIRSSPDGTKLGLITTAPQSYAVLLRDAR